ncbi:hypothetical protein AALP_AAs54867U000100 [Arabis alpina]|uniref:Uncharacterized protein n=1 Tax=Arabis alpina TaxID=50452 RepID=A0A087FY17_ARAAL|nr:hypothetical protein AALP_AAs54867U000100 [Arabis alpina]
MSVRISKSFFVNSCVIMTAAVPELLPMKDTLIRRHECMWKRWLRFILKMTSGAVYSIVMHSFLITVYTLLIFQIFYTRGFDLHRFVDKFGLFFMYLMLGLGEIALRASIMDRSIETRRGVTTFGHASHMVGCILLSEYMLVPLHPIEAFAFFFLRGPFLLWCIYILFSFCIPEFLEDESLIQPWV